MTETSTPESSSPAESGQVSTAAADVYDEFFVPALFGQWPPVVLDEAGVGAGDDVLDVGCGTGILARATADRVTDTGSVTAVDINEGMLAVARRTPGPVDWQMAGAEDLPFPDRTFDHVVSQFALMFFADRRRGLEEMARVTRPGGRVTIATWARIEDSPGYAAMVELLDQLFGERAAAALRAPYSLGTEEQLRDLIDPVFGSVTISRHAGTARFGSIEAWVHTDIRGWTLADLIDDDQYQRLLGEAGTALAGFVDETGRVSFAAPALITTATV